MLNLLLARHGQSEWNAVGRWQGQEDPPLSELGRAQARGAATHAGSFDALFASDLERAHHTATIIGEGIGVGPVIITANVDLTQATMSGPLVEEPDDCLGDFNGDGVVNGADFGSILASWGSCPGCPQDLNDDGIVSGADVGAFLALWGPCP